MEFNAPLSLRERQRYAEGSNCGISTRDDRNNSFLWKKGVQHSEQQQEVVQGLQRVMREVGKLKRRIVGGFVSQVDTFTPFPFCIYNIKNSTDSSKNTQTFQIRDGLVGFRPQYVYPGQTIVDTIAATANGNYEMPLLATGTDGLGSDSTPYEFAITGDAVDFSQPVTANAGASITFDGTVNPLLICSNQTGTANPAGVQIVIDPGANASFRVSFWIKVVDSAGGSYAELWASLSNGASVPYFASAAPNPDQTFAIGLIDFSDNEYTISQCQYGHLFNRYLEQMPRPSNDNTASGSPKFFQIPQIQRGRWTGQALSGKIFYPGDVVVDDTTPIVISGFSVYKSYIYINDGINIEAAPPFAGPSWQPYQLISVS